MGVTGVLLAAGVPAAHWFVGRLPRGDTGVPDNWFPAAALYLFALAVIAARGRGATPVAVAALAVSAAFGAALFGYTGWFPRLGYPGPALDGAVTAVASIAAIRAVRDAFITQALVVGRVPHRFLDVSLQPVDLAVELVFVHHCLLPLPLSNSGASAVSRRALTRRW
jgi:hypothetical protein